MVNQGRFTWEWTWPDSVSSSSPLILDATRTSVIEVPQSSSSVGEYSCTVRYHSDTGLPASPASANFTVEVECKLRESALNVLCMNVLLRNCYHSVFTSLSASDVILKHENCALRRE